MIKTTEQLLESIKKVRLLLNNQGLEALNEDMFQVYLRIEALTSLSNFDNILIEFSQEEFNELQNHINAVKTHE